MACKDRQSREIKCSMFQCPARAIKTATTWPENLPTAEVSNKSQGQELFNLRKSKKLVSCLLDSHPSASKETSLGGSVWISEFQSLNSKDYTYSFVLCVMSCMVLTSVYIIKFPSWVCNQNLRTSQSSLKCPSSFPAFHWIPFTSDLFGFGRREPRVGMGSHVHKLNSKA